MMLETSRSSHTVDIFRFFLPLLVTLSVFSKLIGLPETNTDSRLYARSLLFLVETKIRRHMIPVYYCFIWWPEDPKRCVIYNFYLLSHILRASAREKGLKGYRQVRFAQVMVNFILGTLFSIFVQCSIPDNPEIL